jgi:hypothetical protein
VSAPPRIDASAQTVTSLPADHELGVLVGRWRVEFRWKGRRELLSGTLEIRDSLVRQFPMIGIRGVLAADFAAAFDWTPPCVDPSHGIIDARIRGSEVELDFSPGCRDNNLVARGTLSATEVSGRWSTVHFAGPGPEGGTFRMWREGAARMRPNDGW